ncbi:bifunctional diguanylate cyclase/phosphodiesterase, partial [Rhodovastum atsumiense]
MPLVMAMGFGLVIAVGTGALVMHLRQRTLQLRSQELQRLALVLADQAERAFQGVELVQTGLIERLRTTGVETPGQFRQAMTGEAAHHDLQSRIRGLPQISALVAFDSDGQLLNLTRAWPVPAGAVAGVGDFQDFMAAVEPARFFAEPVAADCNDHAPSLCLARKMAGPDGHLLGLIFGVVELAYFERLYAALSFDPDSTILLMRDDGSSLARFPPIDPPGPVESYCTGRFGAMRIAGRHSWQGRGISPLDGQDRLVAFHLVQDYPLVVGTTVTVAAALLEWRRQAATLGVAVLLLEVLMLGTGLLATRHLRRQRSEAEAQAAWRQAEADARLGAALRSMSQALCIFDADNRVVMANDQMWMSLGAPPGDSVGLHITDLVDMAAAQGKISVATGAQEKAQILAYVATRQPVAYERDLLDGTSIVVRLTPLEKGGWLATCEDITERRRAEARILHLAQHDSLTGLPNRVLFHRLLQEALGQAGRGGSLALLCLGLDGFKLVNDTLGHPAGDALLRAATARLHREMREHDILARLGGDEFAIIQAGPVQPDGAIALAGRLVALLDEPFDLDGHQALVGVSIGITVLSCADEDADTVLKQADLAMDHAKARGGSGFRLFEPGMDAAMQHRRALELDLRHALEAGQFELFYQPVMDVLAPRIHDFEALLRWRHPRRGLIPPADFIPFAEETGLIRRLGAWALGQACAEAMRWPEHIKVAVNLSSVQFVSGDLVQQVRNALAASGLPAHRLELEITETVLIEDAVATLGLLDELKGLGIGIALDDFGTGYSSLSYLRKFPVSCSTSHRWPVRVLRSAIYSRPTGM